MVPSEAVNKLSEVRDSSLSAKIWKSVSFGAELGRNVPGDILLGHVRDVLPDDQAQREAILSGVLPQYAILSLLEGRPDYWIDKSVASGIIRGELSVVECKELDGADDDLACIVDVLCARQVVEAVESSCDHVLFVVLSGQPICNVKRVLELIPDDLCPECDLITGRVARIDGGSPAIRFEREPSDSVRGKRVALVFQTVASGVVENHVATCLTDAGAKSVGIYAFVDDPRRRMVHVDVRGAVFTLDTVLSYGVARAKGFELPCIAVG
jgi:hypoxanthine-guanine phosphoribosyltransferase